MTSSGQVSPAWSASSAPKPGTTRNGHHGAAFPRQMPISAQAMPAKPNAKQGKSMFSRIG